MAAFEREKAAFEREKAAFEREMASEWEMTLQWEMASQWEALCQDGGSEQDELCVWTVLVPEELERDFWQKHLVTTAKVVLEHDPLAKEAAVREALLCQGDGIGQQHPATAPKEGLP